MQALWTIAALAVLSTSTALAQEAAPKLEPAPQPNPAGVSATVVREIGDGTFDVLIGSDTNGAITVGEGLFLIGEGAQDVEGRLEVSPHWIGLGCSPAPDALRAQLGLTETGLVVYDVVDSSPAQAAGFKKHDVLLRASVHDGPDLDLKDAGDLVTVVKKSNLRPFQVFLIRSGKPMAVTVTPAERPQPQGTAIRLPMGAGVTIDPERVKGLINENKLEELKQYIQKQSQAVPASVRLHMAGPVVAPPPAGPMYAYKVVEMPDNLTISITKTGKEPAVVKVQRGEDWWRATENELETIPEELRGHVQRLLQEVTIKGWKVSPGPGQRYSVRATATKTATSPMPPGAAAFPTPPGKPVPPNPVGLPIGERQLQHQLEQQQRQLDAVIKQLEDLKQALEKRQPKN